MIFKLGSDVTVKNDHKSTLFCIIYSYLYSYKYIYKQRKIFKSYITERMIEKHDAVFGSEKVNT